MNRTVSSFWLPVFGLKFSIDFILPTVYFTASTVNFVASTVNFLMSSTYFAASTVNFLMPTAHFRLSTVHFAASTVWNADMYYQKYKGVTQPCLIELLQSINKKYLLYLMQVKTD